jgi:hypothetical protein
LRGREWDVCDLVFGLEVWKDVGKQGAEGVGGVEEEVEADGVEGVECCCWRVGDCEGG